MRLSTTITLTCMVAASMAALTYAAPTKNDAKLSAADQKLYTAGKSDYTTCGCMQCHGAKLKGAPGFAPSLLPDGVMSQYDEPKFIVLMTKNIGYNGKKLSLPMSGKLSDSAIKELFVYLKNEKGDLPNAPPHG